MNVNLESVTPEMAARYNVDALNTMTLLLEKLTLRQPSGEEVSVKVHLNDDSTDVSSFANASASRQESGQYQIEIGIGLVAQLWTLARGIAADKTQL